MKPKLKRNDTIKPYYGEFLVNPIPLELSGNYCSHNCYYCFANLNSPQRRLNFNGTMRLIEQRHERKSLEGKLLSLGYPVLISNHVDPFSKSNYRPMLEIMRKLIAEDIPVSIQTRGGFGVDEALSFLPPSVWYISITHDQERTRKQVEPHAPSIHSRFDLIRRLTRSGHRVLVGANPLCPEWIKSPYDFFQRIANAGAEGVWMELVHLNYKQRNKLKPRERIGLGEETIKLSMKRNPPEPWIDFLERCRTLASECGLETYSIGQGTRSDYFEPFFEVYGLDRTFPVMQEFVNHCYDSYDAGNHFFGFGFEEWQLFFEGRFPELRHNQFYHYIENGVQRVQLDFEIPKDLGYGDVLRYCWMSDKISTANPIQCYAFSYLAEGEIDSEEVKLLLEDGLPTFAFTPGGMEAKYLLV